MKIESRKASNMEEDRYYIQSTSTESYQRTQTLNYGDTFAIFDRWGDVKHMRLGQAGIFYRDTRYVSDFDMYINGYKPMILGSEVREENHIFIIDLTNPDMLIEGGGMLQKSSIYINRSKFLLNGILYERILLKNYALWPLEFDISFSVESDFKDIFEIRGTQREKRGKIHDPEIIDNDKIHIRYTGLDDIDREVTYCLVPKPKIISANKIYYDFQLGPGESTEIECRIECLLGNEKKSVISYRRAFMDLEEEIKHRRAHIADFYSNNELFNNWVSQSKHDTLSLIARTQYGPYPYAGVPWYNTAFGRDGIITALFTLWVAPEVAKGVLFYLARTQAKNENGFRDSEPGKILHETRQGEMANTEEVPFGCYYGTVDATPLFVMLAGMYFERTNDLETITRLWDNIKLALEWIDKYGDRDGDGFVEYEHKSDKGLYNQGWKDSHDSIMHLDGTIAASPIALCEVQGYVYEAKSLASKMAAAMGDQPLAEKLNTEAGNLSRKFNDVFWDNELETYVLALDGEKNHCRVKASNAGHCLFTGIADPDKALKTVQTLMTEKLFTGWGIRTLANDEVRYNPMSYHNGSVWPHDSAIAAAGMARYGYQQEAVKILTGMFEAALFLENHRLPELFCGFTLRQGHAPVLYPVACSPQAWAVTSIFMFIQACLQVSIDAHNKIVTFDKPRLPDFIDTLKIENIPLGSSRLDIEIFSYQFDTGFHIISKPDDWEVIVKK